MEMRKFIIEINPDGTLTCCEYEDPKEAAKSAMIVHGCPVIGRPLIIVRSK